MIELPLVFVAGILGTAHCLGMCGPFVLAIGGAATGWSSALVRQLAYTAGRVFTYCVLGTAAGYGGARLSALAPALVNLPALLAIAAGILLVYQGLKAANWLPGWLRSRGEISGASCLAGGLLGQFLRQPGSSGAFLAGLFTGLLPCGLLYGMLALATSTHSIVLGGLTMAVFGLGTAPLLIVAGLGGRLLGLATRRWLYAAAAWCLVLTGAVSVARGISYLSLPPRPAAGCPLCSPQSVGQVR
jgi:sulfite exporter TauE/SafE